MPFGHLGGPGESVTTCGPATGSPCALGQVTSIFGPQFTICQKTWQKCADWVSSVSRALGQVLLQPEPQFPYLGHEVIELTLGGPWPVKLGSGLGTVCVSVCAHVCTE